VDRSQTDRSIPEAVCADEPSKEDGFLSLGAFDAEFLHHRAGANLSPTRRRILTRAKGELRKQFGRA